MAIDPVCKMYVDEDSSIRLEFADETHYFCSEGCRDKFLKTSQKKPRSSYELIIIGGGPAGLTAAVYAAILKTDAFLLARGLGGQAIQSAKIENYMGYDFITGPELIEKFKHQLVSSHYVDHLLSDVEKIEPMDGGGFSVVTSEQKKYTARTLIIATGMTRRDMGVDGEEKFQRKGVFYGNIEDLSYAQGEDVAVIGGGNSALQIVDCLHTIARKIHLVSRSELSADRSEVERIGLFKNLQIYENFKVTELTGDAVLSGITIRKVGGDETLTLPVKGVFVAVGLKPNSSLVSKLVDLDERSEIIINPDCSTSFPGIFAAGDVTNAFGKRIIIAAGEGAKAAMAARRYILDSRRKGKAAGASVP